MQGMGDSSMRCSQDLLDALHARKERGDSYEDVVWRLLEAETASPDAAAYRDVVERLKWDTVVAKTPERVDAVALAAAILEERGMAAPIVLREEVLAQLDLDIAESSVQRILSDMLGQIPEVSRPTDQIYEWQA